MLADVEAQHLFLLFNPEADYQIDQLQDQEGHHTREHPGRGNRE